MNRRLFTRVTTGLLLLSTLAAAGCFGERRVDDDDIDLISLDRVAALHAKQNAEPKKRHLILLDARSDQRYTAGHIAGAEHLQISDVNTDLGRDPRIESYDNIVVYADNPGSASSRALTKRLLRIRYDDVYMFPGGLDAWVRAGLPTESGE